VIALTLILPFGLPPVEEFGPLLFFLVIVTEVIVAPIPGGVIAFVGSAQLGFWTAWPILYAGNVIGSNVLFHLARRFGRPWVERHTKEKQRVKYERALARHPRLLWIPYAFPVFPIDMISALLGISGLRRRWFYLTTLLALPSYTGITALVGARFGHYIPWLNWISLAILILLAAWLLFFALPALVRRRGHGSKSPSR
jgi:uncharacterized membrane protein YdjX (TVP38/TMEM64 family)